VVETLPGPIVPQMNIDGTITVDMWEPVPVWMWHVLDGDGSTESPETFSAVSMSKPHCIVFVDDLEKDADFNLLYLELTTAPGRKDVLQARSSNDADAQL